MKKIDVALILLLPVALLISNLQVEVTKANFKPGPIDISIISPKNDDVTTNTVPIKVSIIVFLDPLKTSDYRWIAYSLDGQSNVTMIPNYQGVSGSGLFQYSTVTAEGTLSNLPEGYHSLVVYAKYDYGSRINEGATRIKFSVGYPASLPPSDEYTPTITIDNPNQNQNFNEDSRISFSITITKAIAGSCTLRTVGYTLDKNLTDIAGENLKSANGPRSEIVFNDSFPAFIPPFINNNPNITLTGYLPALSTGTHKMQVFLFYYDPIDEYAQTALSNITYFSVGNQIDQQSNSRIDLSIQPFITTLIVACIVLVIIISLGLLIYRKHNHEDNVVKNS
ncbi:MAG TPA: hypothetical protein VK209_09585 [Candidatus Sulfotelmatobacter sp.]|nr:hypothetical protein [Candidatus Sulfotelmatobacter sp.]